MKTTRAHFFFFLIEHIWGLHREKTHKFDLNTVDLQVHITRFRLSRPQQLGVILSPVETFLDNLNFM